MYKTATVIYLHFSNLSTNTMHKTVLYRIEYLTIPVFSNKISTNVCNKNVCALRYTCNSKT